MYEIVNHNVDVNLSNESSHKKLHILHNGKVNYHFLLSLWTNGRKNRGCERLCSFATNQR